MFLLCHSGPAGRYPDIPRTFHRTFPLTVLCPQHSPGHFPSPIVLNEVGRREGRLELVADPGGKSGQGHTPSSLATDVGPL